MATQLSIIRGDTFPTQTITVTSANLDFANITCTGQLRPHPDGNLLYTFVRQNIKKRLNLFFKLFQTFYYFKNSIHITTELHKKHSTPL